MAEWIHLYTVQIKEIHAAVLAAHGGSGGIRDEGLLESAISAPQAFRMGQFFLIDPVEIAAAYLFYLCRNHPFIDGNKRVSMVACITFLRINGLNPKPDSSDWEALVLDVAASRLDRDQTTLRLSALLKA
jgi:death-on-curing protein